MGNDGQTILFLGENNNLKYLEKNDIRFGQSYNNLGFILGIKPDVSGTSAGKTMGLTSYGTVREEWLPYARKYVREYRKLPQKPVKGLRNYGKGHRINSVGLDEIPELSSFVFEGTGLEDLPNRRIISIIRKIFGSRKTAIHRELRFSELGDKSAQDLAKTVQMAWTEQVLSLLKPYQDISRNLCVVGGCALNGITNYAIQQTGLFSETHFVPNPSDCGLSAGAALYTYHRLSNVPFTGYGEYLSPYLGVEPFDLDRLPSLKQIYPYRDLEPTETPQILAQLIYNNLIVGVVRGRCEIGPRALGNRSILCNPLNENMRAVLNQKVKHREWYRPFAPVATAEDAPKYFTNSRDIPYMSVICYVRPEYRDHLPSITHVDGSARLQTIRRKHNSFLWESLKEFEKLSGMPIMLNTSFNPGGEPILNFCAVALEMLKTTGLDLVLIENTLFCQPGQENLLAEPWM